MIQQIHPKLDALPTTMSAPTRLTVAHRVLLALYDGLWGLVILGWVLRRGIFSGSAGRKEISERSGLVPRRPTERSSAIWIHAVSVGEIRSVQPVIARLRTEVPGAWVLLTTSNEPAYRMAHQGGTGADAVSYVPWDATWCVRRALNRAQPDLVAIAECEIWPNLIRESRRRAPVMMINGRIYERDFAGYRRARWIFQPILQSLDAVYALSADDLDRFRMLGVPNDRLGVGGNTKFDVQVTKPAKTRSESARQTFGLKPGPVVVCASTHPGEESSILSEFSHLWADHPNLQIVIAPRDIRRADEIASTAKKLGRSARRRTEHAASMPNSSPTQVLVLDTFGELLDLFPAADVVFVGGSLVDHGGHNPIEPALFGKPVLMGPSVRNFIDVVLAFEESEAITIVSNARALARMVHELLKDPASSSERGRRGREVIEHHRGAADRYARAIAQRINPARSRIKESNGPC